MELGEGILPEWTEDSFPGILLNVAAGRVANRFNLGGPNMAIDAACGSSLAALYAGVRELNDGTSDVAIVMGGDAVQTPYAYVAFSKTHALSPKGRCRPFDAGADGIALAEGSRRRDPQAAGRRRARRRPHLRRHQGRRCIERRPRQGADRAAGRGPASGPRSRLRPGARLAGPRRPGRSARHRHGRRRSDRGAGDRRNSSATRGCGPIVRARLGQVDDRAQQVRRGPGRAHQDRLRAAPQGAAADARGDAEPEGEPGRWAALPQHRSRGRGCMVADHPRTAGVSAFGFGGTNFHTVLEEYTGDYLNRPESGLRRWPAELFVWRRSDVAALIADREEVPRRTRRRREPEPARPRRVTSGSRAARVSGQPTLAVVASSLEDLQEKLTRRWTSWRAGSDRNT